MSTLPDGFDTWDEIRTAYHVARLGTVSAAAGHLGVHHATVIRHVDALESRLGVRLFQRHARGYTPTEAGQDLLSVAAVTDEQFSELAHRLRGRGEAVEGDLVITTIGGLAPRLVPVVAEVQAAHPGLRVRVVADARVFRLEYGEAHVAIRAGTAPQDPDNVVIRLGEARMALLAAPAYATAHGLPGTLAEMAAHRFVSGLSSPPRTPFHRWLEERVPPTQVVFRTDEPESAATAVAAGIGIGFLPEEAGAGLLPVLAHEAHFASPLWLVTHEALHRTAKVQAMVQALRAAARPWHADTPPPDSEEIG
ncbi:MAG: LysR family transcriptional regulator [Rhodobacteraceae bacterium]|nr:LysR family transcriptional regulator [Paracoccaceae bacterium]